MLLNKIWQSYSCVSTLYGIMTGGTLDISMQLTKHSHTFTLMLPNKSTQHKDCFQFTH